MIAIYYFLALIAWFIGAIPLLFLTIKKKYRHSLPARFFLFKNPRLKSSNVHFHACSFGEIIALKPILNLFDNKAITTITKTGFDEASKICKNTSFLPFEIFLPFWLKPSKVLVIFEAELWLMLVFVAKIYKTKIMLINARISDRSYRRYLKFSFFYKKIFSYIDVVYAQSDIDKKRLEQLGAKNIKICGNIKSANVSKPNKNYQKPKERTIIFASTHKGEEELLLKEFKLSKSDKLLIVPRHPERFDEVVSLASKWCDNYGYEFKKFSENNDINAQVVVIDTLGELVNLYAISDIVVLCGSFLPDIGGHNPIEVAQFKNVLISGKYIFNQKALFSMLNDVYFADYLQINELLNKNLKQCSIINKADINEIIQDIKDTI
ncbi:3-deoxy-D-manno-octulosonic-acid transferase (KDO transferase) [Campylobacter pinnipediorum subsp. caledonicus]|uniref:3-deoxy-D-manno-octulosonic acid transferase n=1 Tax=Campylobacter pinnipediorum subsp. caledonicus TaxID=1874362 RepID=A0A1S6U6P5_9BACT|nr:lipid IV(A) 3-deoxy-D-manno-octulosonic acid transferase [Campylobacter pinnipediorum]AQW87418.1 3-deoxy-D-manno-octulosonic-acid transferase (KDO transferase) [Campylobacter pinnipediorum subsp. caledonicus]